MSSVPSGHPLRFFRERKVFLWGKLLTWRIRQVGSKKSPRVRGGFFSVVGSWGMGLRFEIQIDQISIFVYLHRFLQGVEVFDGLVADFGDFF